jgi:Phosducin
MEGQGVTNYAADRPSYAFSSATTEFDDILIRRGVVTLEQALGAKGASAEEARRLAAQATTSTSTYRNNHDEEDDEPSPNVSFDDDDEDDKTSSDLEDDEYNIVNDDEFMQQYRAKRLAELRERQPQASIKHTTVSSNRFFGQVIPIQRHEWTHRVNEASHENWVVVTLTSNHTDITGPTEAAIGVLATHCSSIQFVTIPSNSAIENWPDSNLPSIFIYRHGKMTCELIRMKRQCTPLQLLEELASSGEIDFRPEEIKNVKDYNTKLNQDRQYSLRRHLNLTGCQEEDHDEVA